MLLSRTPNFSPRSRPLTLGGVRLASVLLASVLLSVAMLAASCNPTSGEDTSFQALSTTNGDFTRTDAAAGNYPIGIATGDIDGDLLVDVAVTNLLGNSVTILYGGLSAPTTVTFGVGVGPTDIVLGDFDGLNGLDIAVLDGDLTNVRILLSDGLTAYTWTESANHAMGGVATKLEMVDLDGGGGRTDLIATTALSDGAGGEIRALVNDGSGTFTVTSSNANPAPGRFIIGDWGVDALADLAVLNTANDLVTILLGDGAGGFTEATSHVGGIATGDYPIGMVIFDYDGLLGTDLAISNRFSDTLTILTGDGDGTGTFTTGTPITVGGDPTQIVMEDFDIDGNDDLAVINRTSSTVTILLGDGLGTLTASTVATNEDPFGIVSGQFTADTNLDLAVVEVTNRIATILTGDGAGAFTTSRWGFSSQVRAPISVDWDVSGKDDLILLQPFSNNIVILTNLN